MWATTVENDLVTAENAEKNPKFAALARKRVLKRHGIVTSDKGMYRDPAPNLGPAPTKEAESEVVDLGDKFSA